MENNLSPTELSNDKDESFSQEEMGQPIDDSHLLEFTDQLTEEKVTDKLKNWNSKWDSYSETLFADMKTYYNMYRNMSFSIEGVTTKIPEVFSLIETELPHLTNAIFGSSFLIDAQAKFQDPDNDRTYKVKSYINKLIKDISGGQKKIEITVKNMLIYGWAVVKTNWNTDPDVDINPMTKQVEYINSAHPDFENVDPFAFGFDPNYDEQDIQKIEWCKQRLFFTKNEIKQMRDNGECGDFDDNDLGNGTKSNKGKEIRESATNQQNKSNKIFVDEFWATLYSKDEEGKLQGTEYRIWFLNNTKVIRFNKNTFGFKPFAITRCYSHGNEFLGSGEPEVIGAIAAQLSYTWYQIGLLTKKVGQNPMLISTSTGISPLNLKLIENGVIFTEDMEGFKALETVDPEDITVLNKQLETLYQAIENITGIGPTLQGELVTDVTATQSSIVNQNASNRLAEKLTHLQQDLIVPLARIFFLMNKQLLEEPVQFYDSNNNLIGLGPEDFEGNYVWTSNGSINQSNKALQMQQNQQFIQLLIQAAGASTSPASLVPFKVNIPAAIQEYVAPYSTMPNLQNVIQITPPPMMPQPPMDPNGQPIPPPMPATGPQVPGPSPMNTAKTGNITNMQQLQPEHPAETLMKHV